MQMRSIKMRLPERSILFFAGFFLFFTFGSPAFAAITGKIAGRILDAETGEPLPGTNVVIVGTDLGAAADVTGHYFIINIPPGTYSVQASAIGYEAMTQTDVRVSVDHTTPLNFDLRPTTLVGEAVTVVAAREIVKMDVSSSSVVAQYDQIVAVPFVTDVTEYTSLMAGVEGDRIRGGGLDQTAFVLDGLTVVDNRSNEPLVMINLSSVAEMSIITGGFNAEYGNIRSGLINIVTKEGDPNRYHGSLDLRYSPPLQKHRGASLISPDNFYLRPYLDPEVMWEGTTAGGWDEETKLQYPEFIGWDAVSAKLMADADPGNDRTPDECRDLFLWEHASEGSAEFGQKEMEYGHKPDWFGEVSLGGPVPLLGRFLGNMTFFSSYKRDQQMFGLPSARDYWTEENAHLKLTSRLTPKMKLTVEGLFGEIQTLSFVHGGPKAWMRDPDDIFRTNITEGNAFSDRAGAQMYFPSTLTPFNIHRRMYGIAFDHALSPSTFYNIRITSLRIENEATENMVTWRDTATIRYFGNTPVDEAPYGFWYADGIQSMQDGMYYGAIGSWVRDSSKVNTISAKFDLTSQIDRYNQIKMGFLINYDDIYSHYGTMEWLWNKEWTETREYPYRIGAYIQNKLEFEGMIANFGLRLDYNDPNTDWYTLERYSQYFKPGYHEVFRELAPKEPTKGHLKLSPRLGISHPITARAKLYFNYGHFYSMPSSEDMFDIYIGSISGGIANRIFRIGNPSADIPRTVAYELGVEYNIGDLFMLGLAGYYKDVTNQTGDVRYINIDGTIDYETVENNHYADVRGFEIRVERPFGRWLTGWLNYNYIVTTDGFIGREVYYEDKRLERLYGIQNPYQEIPLARPFLRTSVFLTVPTDYGFLLGGLQLALLYTWKAGRYETWDPLNTYELFDNVQWKDRHNVDARISKQFRVGRQTLTFFADINNLFDTKYLETIGFQNRGDERNYMESLHLPMYDGPEYEAQGLIKGDDRPGDIKSDDKDYIDMPDRNFLTYLNPRSFYVGLRYDF